MTTSDDVADGPGRYDSRTAPQLATEAEDSLRGIAHLTELDVTPLEPHELYRTLSALSRAVEQLPESITRVSAQLSTWSGADGLVVTAGPFHGDPDAAIRAMNEAVDQQVVPALQQVQAGLDRAQAAVNQLTRRQAAP